MSILEHLYENVFTYVREQGAYNVSTDIDEVKKIKDKIICSEAVSEETLCHLIGMANMLVYHANMYHEINDFEDTINRICDRRKLLSNGTNDLERAYKLLLTEFKNGLLGQITLEWL